MPVMSSGMSPMTKQLNRVTLRPLPAPEKIRPPGRKRKSSMASRNRGSQAAGSVSGAARARATRRQVSETVLSTGSPSAALRRYFMSQICWEIDAAFAITAPAFAGSPGRRPRRPPPEARKSLKTQCFQWIFQNPL